MSDIAIAALLAGAVLLASTVSVEIGLWVALCARNLGRARRERDEQAAVVLVRRKEVAGDRLRVAGARPQLDLLPEPAHAPFEGELRRIALVLEACEPEALHDVRPEQIALAPAGEL